MTLASAEAQCRDCKKLLPADDFPKIRTGAGRASRCRGCVMTRYREHTGSDALPPALREGDRPLSPRAHMVKCAGCGERLPRRHLWRYQDNRGRSRYCIPCTVLRRIERPCAGCHSNKDYSAYRSGLEGVSPYCAECRERNLQEKRCPRCSTLKRVADFGMALGRPTGWCKRCIVDRNRERREALRQRGC